MIKNTCSIIGLVLISAMASAQSLNNGSRSAIFEYHAGKPLEVKGSPFIDEEFRKGVLHNAKGNPVESEFRYNAYLDVYQFRRLEGYFELQPRPGIKKIIFENDSVLVRSYYSEKELKYGFFFPLYIGPCSLYKKQVIGTRLEKVSDIWGRKSFEAEFYRTSDQYYFQLGEESVSQIFSVKKMIEKFPQFQKELMAYARKNNIRASRPEELTLLFRYYNALINRP